jgi:hypothetical protein
MSSNWWANKMGASPAPRQEVPTQQPLFQQPAYQQPQMPPAQQPQLPPVQMNSCPGCGSGNYGGATPEARKRCYDCGYPLTQSGTGMGKGISVPMEGPTQAAQQVQTGGWNPTTIIGKLE